MSDLHLQVSYNAPVTLTFTFMCFAATLLGIFSQGYLTQHLFSVYRSSPLNLMTYVRLITHVIGHANLAHFMGNAMYLLLLGPMLEEKYGAKTMCLMIVSTAVVTGLIHMVFSSSTALCGASGVVFACVVLASFTATKTGFLPLSTLLVVVLYLGKELYSCFFIHDEISNATHILGGLVGAAFGVLLNLV